MMQQTLKAAINPRNPDKQITFLDTILDKNVLHFLHFNLAIGTMVLFEGIVKICPDLKLSSPFI